MAQQTKRLKNTLRDQQWKKFIIHLNKNGVPDSLKLTQPMAILSGQYVGSAAEDFVQLMKENNRAVIVGEPTIGCIGEPMFIDLPYGYKAMISAKAYITNEGSQLNDTGILPDIEVKSDFIDF